MKLIFKNSFPTLDNKTYYCKVLHVIWQKTVFCENKSGRKFSLLEQSVITKIKIDFFQVLKLWQPCTNFDKKKFIILT